MPRKRRETEQNETDLLYYELRIIVSTSSNYLCFFSTDLSAAHIDNGSFWLSVCLLENKESERINCVCIYV